MSKNTIIVSIALLVALGAGMWWWSGVTPETETPTESATGELTDSAAEMETTESGEPNSSLAQSEGSIRTLLARGDALECNFSFAHEDGTTGEGTGYFAGDERMRMETTVTQDGETVTGTYVIQGDVMYMWGTSQGQSYAMQMPYDETTESEQYSEQVPVDMEENVSYECSPWTVNASIFQVPEDQEFMDMGAMMQGMQNMEGMSQEDMEALQEQFGGQ